MYFTPSMRWWKKLPRNLIITYLMMKKKIGIFIGLMDQCLHLFYLKCRLIREPIIFLVCLHWQEKTCWLGTFLQWRKHSQMSIISFLRLGCSRKILRISKPNLIQRKLKRLSLNLKRVAKVGEYFWQETTIGCKVVNIMLLSVIFINLISLIIWNLT